MALDIGAKRIGVAIGSSATKLASPLVTLANDQNLLSQLKEIIGSHMVNCIVAGLPRGLDGQTTEQTESVKSMVKDLESKLGMNIVFQDEALTSAKAKQELVARGKLYAKADVDKLAACYILEDYMRENFN